MSQEFLTTKELAQLLRIKERKVYDLAASGEVPCSKAMGKLLFPRAAIDAWIAQHSSGVQKSTVVDLPNVFLGSHDPLLEWALRESGCGIATYFDGSADGLNRFVSLEGLATGLHLYDRDTNDWNVSMVKAATADRAVVLITWATRRRGLIVSAAMDGKIQGLPDLVGRRVSPRQAQSGAQRLLQDLLQQAQISDDQVDYGTPMRSEADAALQVLEDRSDASFGLEALAVQYGLSFIPIIEEHFDLLIDRRYWFEPPWQRFLEFCHSEQFAERAAQLSGYRIEHLGSVKFNGP